MTRIVDHPHPVSMKSGLEDRNNSDGDNGGSDDIRLSQ